MRKKALLAGAVSSFEGPWVNLEAGEWLVEPTQDIMITCNKGVEEETFGDFRNDKIGILGPIRIRATVKPDYSGPGIFLTARQISNGDGQCSQ